MYACHGHVFHFGHTALSKHCHFSMLFFLLHAVFLSSIGLRNSLLRSMLIFLCRAVDHLRTVLDRQHQSTICMPHYPVFYRPQSSLRRTSRYSRLVCQIRVAFHCDKRPYILLHSASLSLVQQLCFSLLPTSNTLFHAPTARTINNIAGICLTEFQWSTEGERERKLEEKTTTT